MSPFISCHIHDLRGYQDQILHFIERAQLDKITNEQLFKYFNDVLCLGTAFDQQRLPLLSKVIAVFHKGVFESVLSFHCFMAENLDWFKAVLQFCQLPFAEESIAYFQELQDLHVQDVVNLASIGGVVPLHTVNLLSFVTKEDSSINWSIINAIAMVDACNKDDKKLLVKLKSTFNESTIAGVKSLFVESFPPYIVKYFFFELFCGKASQDNIVDEALSFLANFPLSNGRGNEALVCGTAFLLNKAFSLLLKSQDLSSSQLCESLTHFISVDLYHFALAAHCAFDVVFLYFSSKQFDGKRLLNFCTQETPLYTFFRLVMTASVLLEINELSCEQASTYHELLTHLLKDNLLDIREATLFVLRCLSAGGTANIAQAVTQIRSGKYTNAIAECDVINAVNASFQTVSPLAWYSDFSSAISYISDLNSNVKQLLERFKGCAVPGKVAAIGSYCLNIGPKTTYNFTNIFSDLCRDLPQHFTDILQSLAANKEIQSQSHFVRQLILAFFVSILLDSEIVVYLNNLVEELLVKKTQISSYRKEIEEMMVPKCPRCKHAFHEWDGCFSVTCSYCGCKFCGHCLLDCGNNAYPHLNEQHGGHSGTREQFMHEFGAIASSNIINYLTTIPLHLKSLVEAEIPGILKDNPYFVRPEQIVPITINTPGLDAPPVVQALLDTLLCCGHIWNKLTRKNSDASSLSNLFGSVQKHIQAIRVLLFPTGAEEFAFSWVHAMLWKLSSCKVNKQNLSKVVVGQLVQDLCREYQDPLILLSEFDQMCRKNVSDILKELQLNEVELSKKPFDDTCRRALLMLPRTRFSFEHQFQAHLQANYDTYPLLNLLAERKTSLHPDTVSITFSILEFLKLLQRCAKEKGITRAFASTEGSFFSFIKSYGEPLTSIVKTFENDFVKAFKYIYWWQCKDSIHRDFCHMEKGIPQETKLACFLPQEKECGILSMALWSGRQGEGTQDWEGVPHVQNRVYDLTHNRGSAKVTKNPFLLVKDELVQVDFADIVDVISSLFIVPGYQPRLSSDLFVAESIWQSRLAFYPYVASELPEYKYGLEGIFAEFQNYLEREHRHFVPLPPTLLSSVKALLSKEPHASDLIYSFCIYILLQENSISPLPKEVFEIKMDMPLTDEQKKGMQTLHDLPTAIKSFCIEHIPAMMGLCWNHQVHESADVAVQDLILQEEISNTLQKIASTDSLHRQIPDILASLRAAGICFFINEISQQWADIALSNFLTTVSIPCIDSPKPEEEDIVNSPPFSVPSKHFGYVLRQAEEILGRKECTAGVPVVPFSAVRPLLKSHVVPTQPQPAKQLQTQPPRQAQPQALSAQPTQEQMQPQEQQPKVIQVQTGGFLDLDLS